MHAQYSTKFSIQYLIHDCIVTVIIIDCKILEIGRPQS